jgi:SpoVK/Ycf46/Vps4 family AAA+-type ATPase
MADKQKAHASAIAKKNAAIQELEKEKQDYIKMHYEMVVEVDGVEKCSKETLIRSIKDAAEFKRQAALSARMSIVRLHKWRHWKDPYMTKVEEIELEQEHFADELEKSKDKISNQQMQ